MKEGKKPRLGRDAWKESHLFQIVLRQRAKRRGRENNKYKAAVRRSDSQQTLNFSLEKKVYKMNFITALQRCCKINIRFKKL